MAVQAQNPSPALFNRNKEKEGSKATLMDYCTTARDQASGRKKRGRDQFSTSLQHQTHVSTGLHLQLSFNQEEKMERSQPIGNGGNRVASSFLPVELAAQMKLQSDELDMFLQIQGERLRRKMAEWREGHYRALAEGWAARRVAEKEAEVETAARRTVELTEMAARLEAEAAAWKEKARVEEAAATELQASLTQVAAAAEEKKEARDVEDATSACEGGGFGGRVPLCRVCGEVVARVVALPCRHLCLCARCDVAAAACPVCCCVKSASVEVHLSW